MKITARKLGLILLVVAAGNTFAQDAGHLTIETVVQKEEVTIDETGNRQTRLVDADTVIPGDEVIYTVSFANVSGEPAENVVITNPIPEQLSYVEGSAFGPGADVRFSVDGGKSFAAPDELVVSDNGNRRSAAAEDFTHIRWVMTSAIAPGDQGMAQFRARLN